MNENMAVMCSNPVFASEHTNVISAEFSNIVPVKSIELNFEKCLTVDDLCTTLYQLNNIGLHIMGSRGRVYSSERLADCLQHSFNKGYFTASVFPRTFGLRKKVLQIVLDIEE